MMEQDEKNVNVPINEIVGMRNHISSVLEQMWSALLVVLAFFFFNEEVLTAVISFMRTGNILKALAAMGIFIFLFLIIIAFYLNRWYKTTITVKENMVIIRRRTLNRYENSIAVQNISNINLEQNLFEMLMRTYKLKLDTNSLSTAESTDVNIVLSKKNAYLVKNLIMDMMKQQEAAKKEQEQQERLEAVEAGLLSDEEVQEQQEKDFLRDDEEKDYDVIYDTKNIVMNCVLHTSLILLLVSVTLLVTTIISIVHTLGSGLSIISGIAGIMVQLMFVASFISALFKQWLDDFNFRAKRYKDKIYVSTGLIKKRKYAVPVNKINAVCFQATFLSRMFHRSYVKVINIGGEGAYADGMKLLLMGTEEELKEQLSTLLPEYPFPEHTILQRQPKRVLAKGQIKLTIFMLVAVFLGYIMLDIILEGCEITGEQMLYHRICFWALLAAVVIFVLLLTATILKYFSTGLSSTKHYLMLSRGMFAKEIITIPYKKMQYLTYRQNVLGRLLNVKRLQIWILASIGSRLQGTGYYFSKDFDEVTEHFQKSYREY